MRNINIMGVPKEKEPKKESVSSKSPNDSSVTENLTKKERRKPQALYQPPKKSLQKSSKIEECDLKNENASPPNISNSEKCNGVINSDSQKPKTSRNRRPTVEVYVPKPKVAAQLTDKKVDATPSNKSEEKNRPNAEVYVPKPKVASQLTEKKVDATQSNNLGEKNAEASKKRNRSNHNRNSRNKSNEKIEEKDPVKCLNSSSPVHNDSWANIMEESDLSNSRRSTPEAELNSDNSNSCTSKTKDYKKENRPERSRRPRSRRNSLRQETLVSNQRGNSNKTESSESRKAGRGERSNQSRRGNRFSRSRTLSGKSETADISERNTEKGKTCEKEVRREARILYGHVLSAGDKPNAERRKPDIAESSVPPRFQRNKVSNPETSMSSLPCQNGSGGILKLPAKLDVINPPVEVVESAVCAPMFREPQAFIHKQLFDPNNPSKPEIVNIPAPIPHPGVSFSKMSPPYYSVNNFAYASAPTNVGYIPPPQPAVIPYCYISPEAPSPYVDPRGDPVCRGEPMQCSTPIASLDAAFSRSVCFKDVVPVLPSEPTKRRYKPIVEKNLHEIVLLDKELSGLLSKGFDMNSNALKQCRWKLQLRFENIILADPKYCLEKNPEQSLWKSVFHQIIEMIRKKLEDNPEEEEKLKEFLLNLILEGTLFYENLLEKQQETHGFKLIKILEMEMISATCLPEGLRCVLIGVQKTLIYLGDLARYKEQVNQTTNYGKARSWYLKAQQISPKNGKPYHQLALLALNTNRKLDAVYYFMRSLAASNPFLSAKEYLLNLFEDARKKYEVYEKKRCKVVEETVPFEDNTTERCEEWIKPDGSSALKPTDNIIDSSDLKDLSDVDLNKRFVISFLHVHGKLFTKVGMETFPQALRQMLKEFYFLLQRNPLPMTSARILQLVAINIFSVTNSSLKENGREHGGSSVLQEQAIYTSMIMMSLLMDHCQMLHIAHKSSPEYPGQIISDGLAHLLPAVKVWTDWMSCQKCLWAPVPIALQDKMNVGFDKDVWTSFAELLTALREVDISDPVISNENATNSESIILDEDRTFSGFVPLFDAITSPAYATLPFDKDKAKHCLRISRIQFFGDYLCGITPPYMEFDVESKKFVSLVRQVSMEESFERSALFSSTDESFRENSFVEEQLDDSPKAERDEIQMLKSRKEALSKAKKEKEMHEAKIQAVLLDHENQRRTVLKIKPRYLIPDTNCFIDHLPLFRNILSSTDFHLIVPLVVINELDGLARGTRVNGRSTPEHASRVTVLSKEAVIFLEKQFASRHPHLRAITSQGSILDTISFRSEEMGQNKGTNDDLILTCCLKYCKDNPELYMPKNKDEPITLFREVVLLTDDRNLRVKALAHHVPVRDLLSFLQWANS